MTSKLILMRHGRSAWNGKNLFTGWVDIPLDEKGIEESIAGGKKIRHELIDVVYTSSLVRAQMTVVLALLHHQSGKVPVFLHPDERWSTIYGEEAKRDSLPVHIASALNERMYGELQGLNKAETATRFGAEQVQIWRRSFSIAPPKGESLQMTAERTLPYFRAQIFPRLERGENVFVAAHGNSLRAIVMDLEGLSEDEVVSLEIPTGEPLIYCYEQKGEQGRWRKQSA